MAIDGEHAPLRVERAAPRASTASTDRAASAAVAIQSGIAASSGVARCGSSAMKAAASANCRATCTNSAALQGRRRGPPARHWPGRHDHLAQQREAPHDCARDHRRRQPQPAPQPRQRECRGGDDGEIDHQRPGARRLRGYQHRHHQRAGEAEAGQRRPVQGRGDHGGDADQAEQDEGRSRADEAVERVRGIDRAEGAGGAGGGQHARHMRCGDRLHRQRALGAANHSPAATSDERQQRTKQPRARRGRTRPARSNSAPAAPRRAPAPARQARPPSACRAALPGSLSAPGSGRLAARPACPAARVSGMRQPALVCDRLRPGPRARPPAPRARPTVAQATHRRSALQRALMCGRQGSCSAPPSPPACDAHRTPRKRRSRPAALAIASNIIRSPVGASSVSAAARA